MARQRLVWRENACGFARLDDAFEGVFNGGLHHRVRRVAYMPERCRQVGRADEHAVHAFHGGNRVQIVQRGLGLGLHQQADLRIGLQRVGGVAAKRRCARTAHAADAAFTTVSIVLRVTHGPHQCCGLGGGVYHWHQQGQHAQIKVLLDQHLTYIAMAHGHARDGVRRRVGGNRLQLVQDGAQVVGRMLPIDQQPVETGPSAHLGGVRIGQAEP